MSNRQACLVFLLLASIPGIAVAAELEDVVEDVVSRHMADKQIPGISVAVVQGGDLVFSAGYGQASIEFGIPATPGSVYPISSVSKIFAGLLAVRLAEVGKLNLDASIVNFFEEIPPDKQAITVRNLLQHTHGLEDAYRSDAYLSDTGKSFEASTVAELAAWSLSRPARFQPGADWEYSLIGYVMLARIFELAGGAEYEALLERYVFEPTGTVVSFGGSESVVAGRNALLYELVDSEVVGHVVDFPAKTYAAGGANTSVLELAKLFTALSGNEYIDDGEKQELWSRPALGSGELANYGLGWFSYETSRERWVVGHEGGGASWVIYYPALDLAVIALSNMSGARADSLPFEIAREAMAKGLLDSE